jgi:hypothetical protein
MRERRRRWAADHPEYVAAYNADRRAGPFAVTCTVCGVAFEASRRAQVRCPAVSGKFPRRAEAVTTATCASRGRLAHRPGVCGRSFVLGDDGDERDVTKPLGYDQHGNPLYAPRGIVIRWPR